MLNSLFIREDQLHKEINDLRIVLINEKKQEKSVESEMEEIKSDVRSNRAFNK